MDERRERVEDPDLDVAALEADRVGQRVAVDRGAGDRGVDEPDVDVGQAGLPGDRPLGLAERLALDAVDELLELGLGDRLVGLLALLAVGRREALDQLAGDADHDLGRPEPGHLLGFLERDRAVVDDGRDVGDGARLHVRQALALAADAADRAVAARVDLEDERLGELRPDVERRAGGERLAGRRAARSGARRPSGPGLEVRPRIAPSASARPSRRVPLPWAISGRPPPRPSSGGIAAWTRSPAEMPRATRSSETVTKICGSSASRPSAMTPEPSAPRRSLAAPLSASIESNGRGRGDEPDARRDLVGARGELAGLGQRRPPPPALSRCLVSRSSSWSAAIRSATASTVWAPTASATRSSAVEALAHAGRRPPAPVTASMRRMPEPMLRSPVMTKPPIWPVARQCVPPHSSWL